MKHLISITLISLFSVVAFSQSPVTLKLNLENSKVNKLKNVSKQTIQSNYNGMAFTTEVNTTTVVSYKLISQDRDIMSIEFKFDTIQSKNTSPMGNKETNSAKPAKKTEYLERIMNRFSSSTIIAKISETGKFMGFENYKAFREKILLEIDSVPEAKKDQIKKQADMVLKESVIQSMIEPIFSYLPDNAVKAGDKWETSYSVAGGGVSGMMFNTLTLVSFDQQNAQLSLASELESVPQTGENVNMSMDVKGQSTGNLTVDMKTGVIIKSNEKKHYEGSMTIKNQGNEMKMPLIIDAQSEVIKQ